MSTYNLFKHSRLVKIDQPALRQFATTFFNSIISEKFSVATQCLQNIVGDYLAESQYPKKLGAVLYDIFLEIPEKLSQKIEYPLLTENALFQLNQLADESQNSDVKLLSILSTGQFFHRSKQHKSQIELSKYDHLDVILQKITAENFAETITFPIDIARASYVFDPVTVETQNFDETLVPFYAHLISSVCQLVSSPSTEALSIDAYDLLNRAYRNKGGIKAAKLEAKEGINGGWRYIFDTLTEHFKRERIENHINYVFKTEIDPLDWNSKVSLMKCFFMKFRNILPAEVSSNPPERYVSNWEVIIKAYVQHFEQFNTLLKML